MRLSNPFIILTLFGGLLAVLAGLILNFLPPKNINWFFGYRTTRSRRSQEAWDFAQKFSGKNMILCGSLLSLTSLTGNLMEFGETTGSYIGFFLLLVLYAIPILRTEVQLKKRFGNNP